jgi:hypothetical protein
MPDPTAPPNGAGFPSFVIPTELARIADRAFRIGDETLDAATRTQAHSLGFAVLGAAVNLMRAEADRADAEARRHTFPAPVVAHSMTRSAS